MPKKQRYLRAGRTMGFEIPTSATRLITLQSILTTQRRPMRTAPTPSPQQTCENILIDDKTYNVEHNILPSENAIIDRLLARRLELNEAYGELYDKLHLH